MALEPALALPALLIHTSRTPEHHLLTHGRPILQMRRCDVGNGSDKVGRVVEGLASLHARETRLEIR